ncbi:MAG: sporulation protein YqfD [Bacillota bacterium]
MRHLIYYLRGYVAIIVEGKSLERFINMAVRRGIKFWDVTYLGRERILLRVRWDAVRALRHIARRTASRFRIQGKAGLPFVFGRARRRKALYGGALFFLAALYFLSLFVWVVEVSGTKRTEATAIRRVAAEAGLEPGTLRWRIKEKEVEQVIKERFPAVAWVEVEIKGSRALVRIAEKKLPDAIPRTPAHVVARRAGLVEEVLVLEGQPVVKEGDTVLPGQVLISGEIISEAEGEGEVAPGPPRYTRAKGIVRARVWYQGYGEVLLRERGERPGRVARALILKAGGREVRLYGPGSPPYSRCRVRVTTKKPLQWRNFGLPIEIISREFTELVPYEIRRSRAEARRLAEQRARRMVHSSLPDEKRLLRESVEEVRAAEPEETVRVRLEVEVLEDIGVVREFKP